MVDRTDADFEKLSGFEFKNKELLRVALNHKSYIYENRFTDDYNERLEFLGDSVLSLCISSCLFKKFPTEDEGILSKKRAALVNESTLYQKALELEISDFIRLGHGERKMNGQNKPRLLASTLEAIFGAYFLDQGYVEVETKIVKLFQNEMEDLENNKEFNLDFKTQLQEIAQKRFQTLPQYEVVSVEPFVIQVKIAENILAEGSGKSKKIAEQNAAREALVKINVRTVKEAK